jgi:inhibitor of cysteine peptidase
MKKLTTVALLLLTAWALIGCAASEPDRPTPANGAGEATIDSAELFIMESFPVQVQLLLRGNLADGCTTIREIRQERSGSEFEVTVVTYRDPQAICTMALVPFEERIALNVHGLAAGDYTVNAGGVTVNFRLDMDNSLPGSGDNPAVTAIVGGLSRELAIAPEAIIVRNVRFTEWPDNCLGIRAADVNCAEVITPGYIIELDVSGVIMIFHTNEDGSQTILAHATE